MVVPDWKKAGTSPLEAAWPLWEISREAVSMPACCSQYEWPHEQIWLDYSFMPRPWLL